MYGQLNDRLDGVISDFDGGQPQPDTGAGQYDTGAAQFDSGGQGQEAQTLPDRDPAGSQPSYASTSAQASLPVDGGAGGGADGGAGSGSYFSHGDAGGNGVAGHIGEHGIPDQHGQYMAAPSDSGEAGLASAGDNGGHGTNGGNGSGGYGTGGHTGGSMTGMPMMGGTPGASGDQDRAASGQWRTTGDLFDEDVDTQLRGAFGEGR
jgi:hypothetical protein